jgi:predicted PurR-regulated permease PerM
MKQTVFSSNLVQTAGSAGLDHTTKLILSKDFWKFIVSTICLMTVTLLLALGWRKVWPTIRRQLRHADI